MRGRQDPQVTLLAFIDLETRVPSDHPLRVVKRLADQAQDDCKVREFVRRGGRWSVLSGRRKSWLAGAWTSGVETILPGAERSARC